MSLREEERPDVDIQYQYILKTGCNKSFTGVSGWAVPQRRLHLRELLDVHTKIIIAIIFIVYLFESLSINVVNQGFVTIFQY